MSKKLTKNERKMVGDIRMKEFERIYLPLIQKFYQTKKTQGGYIIYGRYGRYEYYPKSYRIQRCGKYQWRDCSPDLLLEKANLPKIKKDPQNSIF
jgi:hypothetical protein